MQANERFLLSCPVRCDLYPEVGAYAYARGLTISELIRRSIALMIDCDQSADEREHALAAQLDDMGVRHYTPRTASKLARAAWAARADEIAKAD